jgi:hypothetical protein
MKSMEMRTDTREAMVDAKACLLYAAAGRAALCLRNRCAFWEESNGACVIKRLDLQGEVDSHPGLRDWLLQIRSELSSPRLQVPDEPLPPYALLPLPRLGR